jgi:hypothetical protein
MYMGVHRSPAIANYWKHDDQNPLHPIRTHMSQTRFEQIKRYLHIESPSVPKEQKDQFKSRPDSRSQRAPGGLC